MGCLAAPCLRRRDNHPITNIETAHTMNTHKIKITLAFLLSAALAFAGDDVASKHTLTLDGAKKAADAAVAYAKANGAPGSAIAVVDDGGHLLYFVRLDGTFTASPNISIGKAKTAAL